MICCWLLCGCGYGRGCQTKVIAPVVGNYTYDPRPDKLLFTNDHTKGIDYAGLLVVCVETGTGVSINGA